MSAVAPQDQVPKVPTIEEIAAQMPAGGLTLREMRLMWPAAGLTLGEMMKSGEARGLVKCNSLNSRWQPVKTLKQIADKVAAQKVAAKVCQHPNCGVAFDGTSLSKYCADHRGQRWDNWRHAHKTGPRVAPAAKPAMQPAAKSVAAAPGPVAATIARLELPARAGIRAYTDTVDGELVVRIETTDDGAVELVGPQCAALHAWLSAVIANG